MTNTKHDNLRELFIRSEKNQKKFDFFSVQILKIHLMTKKN